MNFHRFGRFVMSLIAGFLLGMILVALFLAIGLSALTATWAAEMPGFLV